MEFVVFLHFWGLLSVSPFGMLIKVPAFLFIKDHKKQDKLLGIYRPVTCTEGSLSTDQDWTNQAWVNIFLLEGNKYKLQVKVRVSQNTSLITICTFTGAFIWGFSLTSVNIGAQELPDWIRRQARPVQHPVSNRGQCQIFFTFFKCP